MAVWIIETDETVEEIAERIARARYEDPCTGWEEPFCNQHLHVWENAHPEDKEYAVAHARFHLKALGIG
jgi:hypothetical protein